MFVVLVRLRRSNLLRMVYVAEPLVFQGKHITAGGRINYDVDYNYSTLHITDLGFQHSKKSFK